MRHGRQKKAPGAHGRTTTGLGIYCHLVRNNLQEKILIQASSKKAPSPLHAEASTLVLATRIADALQLDQVTFLTDNQILARAAAATKISDVHVPWELRIQIGEYKKASDQIQS